MRSACTSSAEKRLDKMKRATANQNESERYKTATCMIDENTLENSNTFLRFIHEQFSSENIEVPIIFLLVLSKISEKPFLKIRSPSNGDVSRRIYCNSNFITLYQ